MKSRSSRAASTWWPPRMARSWLSTSRPVRPTRTARAAPRRPTGFSGWLYVGALAEMSGLPLRRFGFHFPRRRCRVPTRWTKRRRQWRERKVAGSSRRSAGAAGAGSGPCQLPVLRLSSRRGGARATGAHSRLRHEVESGATVLSGNRRHSAGIGQSRTAAIALSSKDIGSHRLFDSARALSLVCRLSNRADVLRRI